MAVTDNQPVSVGNLRHVIDALLVSDRLKETIVDVFDTIVPYNKSVSGIATAMTPSKQYGSEATASVSVTNNDPAFTVSDSGITINLEGTYLFEITTKCTAGTRLNFANVTMSVGNFSYTIGDHLLEGQSELFSQNINVSAGTVVSFKTSGSYAGLGTCTTVSTFSIRC